MTWFDRSGRAVGNVGEAAPLLAPRLSPDGSAIAYGRSDARSGNVDVWITDAGRGTTSRLTSGLRGVRGTSVWAPHGRELAYSAVHPSAGNFYRKGISVNSDEQPLTFVQSTVNGNNPNVEDWSPDGRYVIAEVQVGRNREDLWAIPLDAATKPFPLLQTQAFERHARVSPDSRWLAYSSDETGSRQVYVQSFPDSNQRVEVSTAGGDFPVWSRDGKELYYIQPDRKMMVVAVKSTVANSRAAFEAGLPKALFDTRISDAFDVSKDGRFLMAIPLEQSS